MKETTQKTSYSDCNGSGSSERNSGGGQLNNDNSMTTNFLEGRSQSHSDSSSHRNNNVNRDDSKSPSSPGGDEPFKLKDIEKPTNHDVLCGRGGGTNNHVGNNHWRTLVSFNKRLYISLPKRQKMKVAQSIVRAVRSQVPPGRFLQKNSQTGLWFDIGDQKAQDKTSQALREGAPDLRSDMERESGKKGVSEIINTTNNSVLGYKHPQMLGLIPGTLPTPSSVTPSGNKNNASNDQIGSIAKNHAMPNGVVGNLNNGMPNGSGIISGNGNDARKFPFPPAMMVPPPFGCPPPMGMMAHPGSMPFPPIPFPPMPNMPNMMPFMMLPPPGAAGHIPTHPMSGHQQTPHMPPNSIMFPNYMPRDDKKDSTNYSNKPSSSVMNTPKSSEKSAADQHKNSEPTSKLKSSKSDKKKINKEYEETKISSPSSKNTSTSLKTGNISSVAESKTTTKVTTTSMTATKSNEMKMMNDTNSLWNSPMPTKDNAVTSLPKTEKNANNNKSKKKKHPRSERSSPAKQKDEQQAFPSLPNAPLLPPFITELETASNTNNDKNTQKCISHNQHHHENNSFNEKAFMPPPSRREPFGASPKNSNDTSNHLFHQNNTTQNYMDTGSITNNNKNMNHQLGGGITRDDPFPHIPNIVHQKFTEMNKTMDHQSKSDIKSTNSLMDSDDEDDTSKFLNSHDINTDNGYDSWTKMKQMLEKNNGKTINNNDSMSTIQTGHHDGNIAFNQTMSDKSMPAPTNLLRDQSLAAMSTTSVFTNMSEAFSVDELSFGSISLSNKPAATNLSRGNSKSGWGGANLEPTSLNRGESNMSEVTFFRGLSTDLNNLPNDIGNQFALHMMQHQQQNQLTNHNDQQQSQQHQQVHHHHQQQQQQQQQHNHQFQKIQQDSTVSQGDELMKNFSEVFDQSNEQYFHSQDNNGIIGYQKEQMNDASYNDSLHDTSNVINGNNSMRSAGSNTMTQGNLGYYNNMQRDNINRRTEEQNTFGNDNMSYFDTSFFDKIEQQDQGNPDN